MLRRSRTREA